MKKDGRKKLIVTVMLNGSFDQLEEPAEYIASSYTHINLSQQTIDKDFE
jgi:hypothetical protein